MQGSNRAIPRDTQFHPVAILIITILPNAAVSKPLAGGSLKDEGRRYDDGAFKARDKAGQRLLRSLETSLKTPWKIAKSRRKKASGWTGG